MDLQTLLLVITSIAVVVTLIVGLVYKGHKSWVMTFFQNFSGVFFLFSGWVKAVDPLGTAYKMEDYFAEFESTFSETVFSFVSPIFPLLSNYSLGFSVFMIVLEIVLGLALIIGARPKLSAWLFWIVVAFFTVLTGFTFLTGYVPNGTNFFSFSSWGPYAESNMKVTDCGCFGDFLKLKPKTSFMKDLFLMIPASYFLFRHKDMHQLFSAPIRTVMLTLLTIGVFVYCISNFAWDIPHADFRPFKKGADIRGTKLIEEEAMANVDITHYILENKSSAEVLTLEYDTYLKNYKQYPKTDWKVLDQLKTEPTVESTKISEYFIEDYEGINHADELLSKETYSIMLVTAKLKSTSETKVRIVQDSLYTLDTIQTLITRVDSIVRKFDRLSSREERYESYTFDQDIMDAYKYGLSQFVKDAQNSGVEVYKVIGGSTETKAAGLLEQLELNFPTYTADDLLLKTIVRSNPGIILWKDGKIVSKWHHKKLPSFAEVKDQYMQG